MRVASAVEGPAKATEAVRLGKAISGARAPTAATVSAPAGVLACARVCLCLCTCHLLTASTREHDAHRMWVSADAPKLQTDPATTDRPATAATRGYKVVNAAWKCAADFGGQDKQVVSSLGGAAGRVNCSAIFRGETFKVRSQIRKECADTVGSSGTGSCAKDGSTGKAGCVLSVKGSASVFCVAAEHQGTPNAEPADTVLVHTLTGEGQYAKSSSNGQPGDPLNYCNANAYDRSDSAKGLDNFDFAFCGAMPEDTTLKSRGKTPSAVAPTPPGRGGSTAAARTATSTVVSDGVGKAQDDAAGGLDGTAPPGQSAGSGRVGGNRTAVVADTIAKPEAPSTTPAAGSNSSTATAASPSAEGSDGAGGIGAGGVFAIIFFVVIVPMGLGLGYLYRARRADTSNARGGDAAALGHRAKRVGNKSAITVENVVFERSDDADMQSDENANYHDVLELQATGKVQPPCVCLLPRRLP